MSDDTNEEIGKFYAEERIALFIDGSNLFASARALEFDIDYKKMYDFFAGCGRLIRANYYTALPEDPNENSPIRPLIDWLDYNRYNLVSKPVKEFTDSLGRRKIKGNMDVEIATDIMEQLPNLDHVVLFSGDGDFRRLAEAVQRQGKVITVISTIKSNPPMMADELRRQCDIFIDLKDIQHLIGRAARSGGTGGPRRLTPADGVGYEE